MKPRHELDEKEDAKRSRINAEAAFKRLGRKDENLSSPISAISGLEAAILRMGT